MLKFYIEADIIIVSYIDYSIIINNNYYNKDSCITFRQITEYIRFVYAIC